MALLNPESFFRLLLHGWRVAVPVLEADHRAPAARYEVVKQHGEARQPAPHPAKLHRPQLRMDIFCFDIEISQLWRRASRLKWNVCVPAWQFWVLSDDEIWLFKKKTDSLREIFEKVGISDDLGLSQNSELLLHFFWLQVITVFWAGLGRLDWQIIPGWSKGQSHNLRRVGTGVDFRW